MRDFIAIILFLVISVSVFLVFFIPIVMFVVAFVLGVA